MPLAIVACLSYGISSFLSRANRKKKEAGLKNLLNDLKYNNLSSYYDIEGFKCGYIVTSDEIDQLENSIKRELQNSQEDFTHVLPGRYKLFYGTRSPGEYDEFLKRPIVDKNLL